jgi:flagellar motor switch protein FliM
MPMTAEWHGMEITVREVTQLKAGDVLELSPNSVNQVRLQLADTAKFLGRLGTRDRRWGVEITQVLKSERPV